MEGRFGRAVDEAFFHGEHLDNRVTFTDLGIQPTPGTMAALRGYWRGRNRWDNEQIKRPTGAGGAQDAGEAEYRKRVRERYNDSS